MKQLQQAKKSSLNVLPRPQAPPGGSRDVPRPDGKYNLSSVFCVCLPVGRVKNTSKIKCPGSILIRSPHHLTFTFQMFEFLTLCLKNAPIRLLLYITDHVYWCGLKRRRFRFVSTNTAPNQPPADVTLPNEPKGVIHCFPAENHGLWRWGADAHFIFFIDAALRSVSNEANKTPSWAKSRHISEVKNRHLPPK